MASALDWVRGKAKLADVSRLEYEGDTYESRLYTFYGRVPFRMICELRKATTESGELVTERLKLGGEYRSQSCNVEFYRTEYVKV